MTTITGHCAGKGIEMDDFGWTTPVPIASIIRVDENGRLTPTRTVMSDDELKALASRQEEDPRSAAVLRLLAERNRLAAERDRLASMVATLEKCDVMLREGMLAPLVERDRDLKQQNRLLTGERDRLAAELAELRAACERALSYWDNTEGRHGEVACEAFDIIRAALLARTPPTETPR